MSAGNNTSQGQTGDSVLFLQHKGIWGEADRQVFCVAMNTLDNDDMVASECLLAIQCLVLCLVLNVTVTTLHETMLKRKLSNLHAIRNTVYDYHITFPLVPNFPLAHTLAEFAAIEDEVKAFRDHREYVTRDAQDRLKEFADHPPCDNCSLHKLEAKLSHSKALRDVLQQSDSARAIDPTLLFSKVCDVHKAEVLEELNNDIANIEDYIANRYTTEEGYKITVKYHGLMSPVCTEIETKIAEHRARLAPYS